MISPGQPRVVVASTGSTSPMLGAMTSQPRQFIRHQAATPAGQTMAASSGATGPRHSIPSVGATTTRFAARAQGVIARLDDQQAQSISPPKEKDRGMSGSPLRAPAVGTLSPTGTLTTPTSTQKDRGMSGSPLRAQAVATLSPTGTLTTPTGSQKDLLVNSGTSGAILSAMTSILPKERIRSGQSVATVAAEQAANEKFECLSGALVSASNSQQEAVREMGSRIDDVEMGLRTSQSRFKDMDILLVRVASIENMLETLSRKWESTERRIETLVGGLSEERSTREKVQQALTRKLEEEGLLKAQDASAQQAVVFERLAQLEDAMAAVPQETAALAQHVNELVQDLDVQKAVQAALKDEVVGCVEAAVGKQEVAALGQRLDSLTQFVEVLSTDRAADSGALDALQKALDSLRDEFAGHSEALATDRIDDAKAVDALREQLGMHTKMLVRQQEVLDELLSQTAAQKHEALDRLLEQFDGHSQVALQKHEALESLHKREHTAALEDVQVRHQADLRTLSEQLVGELDLRHQTLAREMEAQVQHVAQQHHTGIGEVDQRLTIARETLWQELQELTAQLATTKAFLGQVEVVTQRHQTGISELEGHLMAELHLQGRRMVDQTNEIEARVAPVQESMRQALDDVSSQFAATRAYMSEELAEERRLTSSACRGLTEAQDALAEHIRKQDACLNDTRWAQEEARTLAKCSIELEKALGAAYAQRVQIAGDTVSPDSKSWSEWGNKFLDAIASPRAVQEGHSSHYARLSAEGLGLEEMDSQRSSQGMPQDEGWDFQQRDMYAATGQVPAVSSCRYPSSQQLSPGGSNSARSSAQGVVNGHGYMASDAQGYDMGRMTQSQPIRGSASLNAMDPTSPNFSVYMAGSAQQLHDPPPTSGMRSLGYPHQAIG